MKGARFSAIPGSNARGRESEQRFLHLTHTGRRNDCEKVALRRCTEMKKEIAIPAARIALKKPPAIAVEFLERVIAVEKEDAERRKREAS